jgi:hypothetical protein
MSECSICKTEFVKTRPMQQVCGLACAMQTASIKAAVKRIKAKQQDKRETKAKLDALNPKSYYVKQAQIAFNTFIRQRDYGKSCICCDKPIAWGTDKTGGVVDCGHYLSTGARSHLRFNENNAAAQLKYCNTYLSGNAANYRIGLIKRVGLECVEALENDYTVKRWTIEELKDIAKIYREKTKRMLK